MATRHHIVDTLRSTTIDYGKPTISRPVSEREAMGFPMGFPHRFLHGAEDPAHQIGGAELGPGNPRRWHRDRSRAQYPGGDEF